MIRRERVTATLDGEFVVFLIGMRINKPLIVHRWLPVVKAMSRMLNELHRQPGLAGRRVWYARVGVRSAGCEQGRAVSIAFERVTIVRARQALPGAHASFDEPSTDNCIHLRRPTQLPA